MSIEDGGDVISQHFEEYKMRNQLEINKEFGKNPTFSKANIFEEKETIEDDAMYENSKQGRSSTSRQHALPKRATEILTRWFNNHIHHPYPTEADKEELSRKTNLKVHQISNWFVNMRARKWKKAIETTERTNTTSKGTLCRGNLPKAAVRKLKVWLFENFENPYPNGLTKFLTCLIFSKINKSWSWPNRVIYHLHR